MNVTVHKSNYNRNIGVRYTPSKQRSSRNLTARDFSVINLSKSQKQITLHLRPLLHYPTERPFCLF